MSIRRAAKKAVRLAGKTTGAGEIARAVVVAHDSAMKKAVNVARAMGVSDKTIDRALKAYEKAHKIQDALSILFPGMPSQLMLRTLSGSESLQETRESISGRKAQRRNRS